MEIDVFGYIPKNSSSSETPRPSTIYSENKALHLYPEKTYIGWLTHYIYFHNKAYSIILGLHGTTLLLDGID